MPADTGRHAVLFEERLRPPLRWWLVAAVGVGIAGAEIVPGLGWRVGVGVYVGLVVLVAAFLVSIGRAAVRLDGAGLHAGGQTLPLDQVASATALDAADTRHRLGPGGDPAAHVVTRGFVPESVLVRPVGADGPPYWLVSSRDPQRLLAALRHAGAVIR